MTLTRYKLGDLIEQVNIRNKDVDNKYNVDDVRGISNQKIFIETKAKMKGVSLNNYKLVKPREFVYMTVTSRNGDKLSVAFNNTNETYIVSSSYIAFKIKFDNKIIEDYLFMILNRTEFDRLSRINSWGSARETLSWEDFCDIKIDLPPLDIQKKYVAIYKAMLENQASYEKGLENLKLACDASLDIVLKKYNSEYLGDFIQKLGKKNIENKFNKSNIRGISIDKKFIDTKANLGSVNVKNYKIVKPNEFAFVTVTSRNSEKISLAMNQSNNVYLCSSTYMVFKVIDNSILNPSYLLLNFNKKQFDRYVRFNSWGSARETFDYSDMEQVKIPVPPIEVQNSIANIYKVYTERKKINEKLKERLKNICPILIKGAVEEAKRKEA